MQMLIVFSSFSKDFTPKSNIVYRFGKGKVTVTTFNVAKNCVREALQRAFISIFCFLS